MLKYRASHSHKQLGIFQVLISPSNLQYLSLVQQSHVALSQAFIPFINNGLSYFFLLPIKVSVSFFRIKS